MDNSNPSLCIPRLVPTDDFPILTYTSIKYVLERAQLGHIKRLDLKERYGESGIKYMRVFVHFDYWYDTERAQKAKQMVLDGKTIKIVYSLLGFWKLSINNWTKK